MTSDISAPPITTPEATEDREVPLRAPGDVMTLAALGSAHQTRLSFMRVLLRTLRREGWRFDRPLWDIDENGVGRALYRARGPRRTYTLVAFAHDLPADQRSDRVIAEAWDATFALFDGEPTDSDLQRLSANVPLQEAGRIQDSELTLSRANRSVRLWAHVVDRLAAGAQPDADEVEAVGYLMRTTAGYGAGKFGAADRAAVCERPLMGGPFRLEMLTVWLIRAFTLDLVEHMARAKGGAGAATLAPALRRRFGVGNSTGHGMAPILVTHPALLHAFLAARERAIARVRSLPHAAEGAKATLTTLISRAALNAQRWRSDHPLQREKIAALRADLSRLAGHVASGALNAAYPFDALMKWASKNLSPEGREQTAALILEHHGELVDALADEMGADEDALFRIDGAETIGAFKAAFTDTYAWAFQTNYTEADRCARFWYVSEEKLEPRLGERHTEPGAAYELPLDTGRAARALAEALEGWDEGEALAAFLMAHPEHRHTVRRAQIAADHPYGEIRDNLISATMLPIDMLRCKLAFFGAQRFDPRSDRWVRICMYQNAPFPHELAASPEDDWAYPQLGNA